MDIVRISRLLEYVGSRDLIEKQIENSLQGTKTLPNGITIRAVTIQAFPENVTGEIGAKSNDLW